MTACAVVSVTEKVATPDPFVVADAGEIDELPPPWASETDWPDTGLPNASVAVTVIVEEATPFAVAEAGDDVTVDWVELTAATLMLNDELVAPVRPADAAFRVYPAPALLIERLEKVATPETAAVLVVPESVPAPGFVPIASVIVAVDDVTVFPMLSATATLTAGLIDTPAVVDVGCWTYTTFDAAPTFTLNVELVAPVRPAEDADSVYPVPTLSIERLEKVATPLTALTVAVPDSVPPDGFVPIASDTEAVEVVTVLPAASLIATVTAGLMDAPATTLVGCWTNATFVGAPAVMLKAELVAPVRPVDAAVSV